MIKKQTVSLCLICRNEAACIDKCLESVRQLVDEMIVVDTGSGDNSKELAKAAGAKVYDFAWCDHFAEARNYGLSKAGGNWILVLDADEVLAAVWPEYFTGLLNAAAVEGYYFKIKSYVNTSAVYVEDQVVRLFKNDPRYLFTGAIHEQIAGSIIDNNPNGSLACADVTILHCGYLDDQVISKNKQARNIGIIKKALLDKPDDPFLRYSLGIEYMQSGEPSKCAVELETALKFLSGREGYFYNALLLLGTALLELNDRQKLQDFFAKALLMFPNDQALLSLQQYNGREC